MSLKQKVILGFLVLVTTFYAGQKSVKPVVETQIVEKLVEVQKKDERTVTVVKKVKRPDGTVETNTTTTSDAHSTSTTTDVKATEIKTAETRLWQVGLMKSLTSQDYALMLGRTVLPNVSIIGTITTDKQALIGAAISF